MVGSVSIPTEDLLESKSHSTYPLVGNTENTGTIGVSFSLYEERRSEHSTHNTSSNSVDLKEEYFRKLNELELEKEELEFYKKNYKRKLEKLNQEKRNFRAKVNELVRRATPMHTEESCSDTSFDFEECPITFNNIERESKEDLHEKEEEEALNQEKEALAGLKEQVEHEISRLRREKHKLSVQKKISMQAQNKVIEYTRPIDITRNKILNKCGSADKLKIFVQDQSNIEQE